MNEPFDSIWLNRLDNPATRDEAAARIFNEYVDQLLGIIRGKLASQLAARLEPQDIMQSVWGSFFRRKYEIPSRASLFALLVEICINKTREATRHHHALKRNVSVESDVEQFEYEAGRRIPPDTKRQRIEDVSNALESTEASETVGEAESDSWLDIDTLRLLATGATAEQAATVIEVFDSLPTELQRVASLRIEGKTEAEIAAQLGCARRTVTRRLGLLRDYLALAAQEEFPVRVEPSDPSSNSSEGVDTT